jgi:anti-sigma B factor antagonist
MLAHAPWEWEMVTPRTELKVHEVDRDDDHIVLAVAGELDIGTVERLRLAVGRHLRPGVLVTLDLAEVTFCDSTGLAALVGIYKRLAATGGRLVLRAPIPRVLNLLTVTGLTRVMTVTTAEDQGTDP